MAPTGDDEDEEAVEETRRESELRIEDGGRVHHCEYTTAEEDGKSESGLCGEVEEGRRMEKTEHTLSVKLPQTTLTELMAIAPAAIIGWRWNPQGRKKPIASGIMRTLYTHAARRLDWVRDDGRGGRSVSVFFWHGRGREKGRKKWSTDLDFPYDRSSQRERGNNVEEV